MLPKVQKNQFSVLAIEIHCIKFVASVDGNLESSLFAVRYSLGVMPVASWKTAQKYSGVLKPLSTAMFFIGASVLRSRYIDIWILNCWRYWAGAIPVFFLNILRS